MPSLPSFRPRGVIGQVGREGVEASVGLRRWFDLVRQAIESVVDIPPGTLRTSFSPDEPEGWKILNGQALSKRSHPDLYDLIGGAYGETADTFNLPDATNRVLIGAGTIALRGLGGASSVTLTTDNLPAHSHGVTDTGHSHGIADPGHTHGVTDPGHTHSTGVQNGTPNATSGTDVFGAATGSTGSSTTGVTVNSAATGIGVNSATTGITINSAGGGQPFGILPLGIGVTVLIKT